MARAANSRILALLLIAVLVVPATADIVNSATFAPEPDPSDMSVPYTITLFIPTSSMVHSTQLMDMVNVPNSSGDVVLATSFGLSLYNGTWSTRHMTLDNVSEGLMDDYITAVEYDRDGNLWIGYSGGIQIYNGHTYRTIRDQQLLKDMQIKDLQRWEDDMWVATGHAGIHRYRDGIWTWYQPYAPGGAGFYEVDSMTIDPVANVSLIATEDEGLWMIRSRDDPIVFESVAPAPSGYGMLNHVRQDPSGGVFFFNDSMVVHYTPAGKFTPVLTSRALSISVPEINDIAADPHGKLYLATDRGIDIWQDGHIFRHLGRFEGIGTSSVVRTVNVDRLNRVWFSTQDNIGYYIDRSGQTGMVPILTPTAEPAATGEGAGGFPTVTPTLPVNPALATPTAALEPEPEGIDAIVGPLVKAIRTLLSGLGLIPGTP